ncbi:MAG: YigZ family protein [Crocinitomicaceae bacterium]
MTIIDNYLTIAKTSEGFYKEKGSKFMSFALPCNNEVDAKSIINDLRKRNPNACHVCFAWRFGEHPNQYKDRFSDDGEPSNSAGKPIHGQIISFNLTNILIAVVRIYGGTNLGVGGLMTAYKTASKAALDIAKIEEKYILDSLEIIFPYNEMGAVMNLLKRNDVNDIRTGYEGESGKLNIKVKKSKTQNLIDETKLIHTITIKKITDTK